MVNSVKIFVNMQSQKYRLLILFRKNLNFQVWILNLTPDYFYFASAFLKRKEFSENQPKA